MKIYDGRNAFYQWDLNQKITSPDFEVGEEVHFSNTLMKKALIVKAHTLEDGTIVADVPNILLQHAIPITVYRWAKNADEEYTCSKISFTVYDRPKPDDYIYIETEIYSFDSVVKKSLLEAKESGDFKGDTGPQGPQGEPGYTPQKEIDYWTVEDKSEIESYVNQKVLDNYYKLDKEIDAVEAIARGASKGKVYYDYYNMWGDISAMPKDYLSVPDHIFLQVVDVPDLWVMHTTDENHIYDFTSNEQFLNDLLEQGMVWVGHFVLSMLETQKVDLVEYAKKSQVPVISATKKENGAYSLTITMGVE
jgi:hypothetical protein